MIFLTGFMIRTLRIFGMAPYRISTKYKQSVILYIWCVVHFVANFVAHAFRYALLFSADENLTNLDELSEIVSPLDLYSESYLIFIDCVTVVLCSERIRIWMNRINHVINDLKLSQADFQKIYKLNCYFFVVSVSWTNFFFLLRIVKWASSEDWSMQALTTASIFYYGDFLQILIFDQFVLFANVLYGCYKTLPRHIGNNTASIRRTSSLYNELQDMTEEITSIYGASIVGFCLTTLSEMLFHTLDLVLVNHNAFTLMKYTNWTMYFVFCILAMVGTTAASERQVNQRVRCLRLKMKK